MASGLQVWFSAMNYKEQQAVLEALGWVFYPPDGPRRLIYGPHYKLGIDSPTPLKTGQGFWVVVDAEGRARAFYSGKFDAISRAYGSFLEDGV
jgi:hypothetical protein